MRRCCRLCRELFIPGRGRARGPDEAVRSRRSPATPQGKPRPQTPDNRRYGLEREGCQSRLVCFFLQLYHHQRWFTCNLARPALHTTSSSGRDRWSLIRVQLEQRDPSSPVHCTTDPRPCWHFAGAQVDSREDISMHQDGRNIDPSATGTFYVLSGPSPWLQK